MGVTISDVAIMSVKIFLATANEFLSKTDKFYKILIYKSYSHLILTLTLSVWIRE